jgi:hypothetical protein
MIWGYVNTIRFRNPALDDLFTLKITVDGCPWHIFAHLSMCYGVNVNICNLFLCVTPKQNKISKFNILRTPLNYSLYPRLRATETEERDRTEREREGRQRERTERENRVREQRGTTERENRERKQRERTE